MSDTTDNDNPAERCETFFPMEYFPLFLRLQGQPVLIVGAGSVAARKVALLLAAEAQITVVAPAMCEEIAAHARRGRLTFVGETFTPDLVLGQRLVVAATDDEAINQAVSQAAICFGMLVNVVDDPALSNCIVPAIIDRDPVLVACSTGGSSPVLATELRAQLETLLPPRLGELARFARRHRAHVKTHRPDLAARRQFWLVALRGEIAAAVLRGAAAEADVLLERHLAATAEITERGECQMVPLCSSDPDQLKLGALRGLFAADLILYDEGFAPALLALGRRDATRQFLPSVDSTDAFQQSRLPALLPALTAAQRVVYLSTQQVAWVDGLASELRAQGILTQVW